MSEKLIYAMSTRGSFGLDQFNEIFRMLYLPAEPKSEDWFYIDAKRYIVRMLDALGYCEFDFDRRMVHMCPPCIASLPVHGLPKAVLTGARSPRLIHTLKSLVKNSGERAFIKSVPQKDSYAAIPASIYIEAESCQVISDIAKEAGIEASVQAPAAWLLANFSASIEDVRKSIVFEKRFEPGWKKRMFDKDRLYFAYGVNEDTERLSLKEYMNPVTRQYKHWLWDSQTAAEVDRDWGRYLVLNSSGFNVVMYDPKSRVMAVPVTVPPPCILARSLAMCSGNAPKTINATTIGTANIPMESLLNAYECVTPSIAALVASKLGQKLISISLKNTNMVIKNA